MIALKADHTTHSKWNQNQKLKVTALCDPKNNVYHVTMWRRVRAIFEIAGVECVSHNAQMMYGHIVWEWVPASQNHNPIGTNKNEIVLAADAIHSRNFQIVNCDPVLLGATKNLQIWAFKSIFLLSSSPLMFTCILHGSMCWHDLARKKKQILGISMAQEATNCDLNENAQANTRRMSFAVLSYTTIKVNNIIILCKTTST